MTWTHDATTRRHVRSDGAEVVHSGGYARPWVAWVGGKPVTISGRDVPRTFRSERLAMRMVDREFPPSVRERAADVPGAGGGER